ncbi:MAG TPA: serine/threonine protein kinase, partial [Myxococcales bacterium]|nr:serine/threonine protein kinase [Myxococcales bacterium]
MQKQDELGVQFGKYQIFAKLAVGGMAELYLAKQPGIGGFSKTVVLKCILPHLANDDEFITMFLDEARVVAPLDHPNIIHIYEIGEATGMYYIVMEYIRGQNLKVFRKRLYRQHSRVNPYLIAAGIVSQVAGGLYYAHTAIDDDGQPLELVHRDISPTNLIVGYNGTVKVVDFGVAKATNQQHHTTAGTIK